MEENKTFTRADGLMVQARNLKFWEGLLKPEVYKLVEAKVKEENDNLVDETGYRVFRGSDIDNFIKNIRLD